MAAADMKHLNTMLSHIVHPQKLISHRSIALCDPRHARLCGTRHKVNSNLTDANLCHEAMSAVSRHACACQHILNGFQSSKPGTQQL